MSPDTELALKEALLAHSGGIGPHLSEEQKQRIINDDFYGRDKYCNPNPVDGDKLLEGFKSALKRHPVEWLL